MHGDTVPTVGTHERIRMLTKQIRKTGLLLALMLVVLTGCSRTGAEEALRERIELLQRNIEERKAGEVEAVLAEDFVGPQGMDRRDARRMAAGIFLRYRAVGATFGPLQLQMQGDTRATVKFTVAATGGSGGLLPSQAQVYDVTTGWRSDDDDGWQMTSADWTPRL